MEQSFRFVRVLSGFCLFLMGWLLTSCNPENQSADPQAMCRIQRIISTSTRGETVETAYDYDLTGKLVSKVQNQRYTDRSDLITITEQYAYDTDDFLTRAVVRRVEKTTLLNSPSTYQSTSTTNYTYADSRLATYTQRNEIDQTGLSSPYSRTTTTTGTYTYDAGGKLTQTTGNGLTTTYQNGQVTGYIGTSPFTVENGLITKAQFAGTNSTGGPANLMQTWQYDQQRRITRYDEALNDTPTNYYTQEWQAGKPSEQSLPAFKGHPVVQSPYGEPGVVTSYRRFYVNQQQGGKTYLFSETNTTSQLNAQGFVTSSTAETTYATNGQKPDTITTVYTYTGCN